jgi:hypothetical protein
MSRHAAIGGIALLLSCLSFAAFALPDLAVDVVVQPFSPLAGQVVVIEAVVSNLGTSTLSDPFFVNMYVDGQEIAVRPVVGRLSPGDTTRVSAEWTALAGPHTITVVVDPPIGRIEESDETNNSATRLLNVTLDAESQAAIGQFKVVISPFTDLTQSGFLNLGVGVADKLAARLLGAGVRVLERDDLESIMQERRLNPDLDADLAMAGRLLGADALIAGSVTNVHVVESSLQLGFLSLSGAEATVDLSARLLDVASSQVLDTVAASGQDEGTTGFSVDLGGFLAMLQSETPDICGGGLQTVRSWYNVGESVPIAYHNATAPEWFSIEISTSVGSFVKWLGWQYVDAGACGVWYWDQQNVSGIQMSPGVYTAKIWDGTAYIAEVSFQIRPGISLTIPPVTEISVGTDEFENTVVGGALNRAADNLTSGLLESLILSSTALAMEREPMLFSGSSPTTREGQIAAVLPDGRIAINIGATSGIAVEDELAVLEVANLVVDPQTQKILSYDTLSVRGDLVIIEVRDRVSFGLPLSEFEPEVGDVVRDARP